MGEAPFQKRVLADLRKLPHCYRVKIQHAVGGTPDILVCLRGRFVAIEVKGVGGQLSKLQRKVLQDIENAGGIALAIWPQDWPVIYDYLKNIHLKRKKP